MTFGGGAPHNKGVTINPLGPANRMVDTACVVCGKKFKTKVATLTKGGGKYCGKRCNPAYPQAQPATVLARKANLRGKYGLSPEDYDEMYAEQNGVCAICGGPPPARYNGHFYVDHSHTGNFVRGLLCHYCNSALGQMRDRPAKSVQAHLNGIAHWFADPSITLVVRANGDDMVFTNDTALEAIAALERHEKKVN